MIDKSKRILGLDLMRAIAVCMVVISHSVGMLYPLIDIPVLGAVVGKVLALTLPFGLLGVEMFFVLSGFLIGNILIREYMRPEPFTFRSLTTFWRNRWFRTLPAYIVVLIVVMCLNLWVYHIPNDFRYFIFSQNLFTPHPDSFGEAWSLSIEEWFYISLPLTLFAARAYVGKNQVRLLYVFVLYMLFFIGLRLGYVLQHDITDPDRFLRKIVVFRLDTIMYGVLIAYWFNYKPATFTKYKTLLLLAGVLGIVLCSGLNYIGTHPRFNFFNTVPPYRTLWNSLLYTLLPLCFALMIPYLYAMKRPRSSRVCGLITHISLTSYSIYLIHSYIVYLLLTRYFRFATPASAVFGFILYWFLVLSLSYLLYITVEKQFLKLRDRHKLKS